MRVLYLITGRLNGKLGEPEASGGIHEKRAKWTVNTASEGLSSNTVILAL